MKAIGSEPGGEAPLLRSHADERSERRDEIILSMCFFFVLFLSRRVGPRLLVCVCGCGGGGVSIYAHAPLGVEAGRRGLSASVTGGV